ncbi:aldehyde dehydrogenase [Rhodococcus erythropolis]|uniref:Aldehyde dehydrogenase n=1 Tax=Rhodococcus erythropolis TaxID=1833 RepID=A0AAX3ZXB1_RHOER|nr:aldehyde dehydrogenase [Rhodococcus erythropolis]WMN01707.1 aldehyde dehydrogenase [Rhodococcus erythropolis]
MPTNNNAIFVGGEWHAPASIDVISVISPNDEQVLGRAPDGTNADMDLAVNAARRAFDDPTGWSRWNPSQRAQAMRRLADALDIRAPEMARTVSAQNGMPVAAVEKLESVFPQALLRYYASLIENDGFEQTRSGLLGGSALVTKSPIGVVGAIVPSNFPQSLSAFRYAPALAAGCTIVIKPAPETVLDSYLLGEAIEEADLPAGVINIVPGGPKLGAYLVSHPGIDKIAFTGSPTTGRTVAEVCGRLLRPVSLELGGKSAAIILDDANLDLEVVGEQLFSATVLDNSQVCHLGMRLLAPQSRYDEVVDAFSSLAASLAVGSSLDPTTMVGPLKSARQRERVEAYIARGTDDGARITVGGGRPRELVKGWFVEPTVFANVDNNYTIAQEEIFGPVLSIISYRGDDDAVRIANSNDFEVGGTVFTSDHDHGVAVARRIQSGTIGINGYLPDQTSSFTGVNVSGLSPDLGPEALSAYLVPKSIYL